MILIVTQDTDQHAMAVINHLDGVEAAIADVAELPLQSHMTGVITSNDTEWKGSWSRLDRSFTMDEITAVWLRWSGQFTTGSDMSDGVARFCLNESRIGFGGVMATWPWFNHPFKISAAEYKPLQLQQAVRSGLKVPATIITNSFDEAQRFIGKYGPDVALKPFTQGAVDLDGESVVLYNTKTNINLLTRDIVHSAHLMQQWIDGDVVRATVVDEVVLSARVIPSTDETRIDYRRSYDRCDIVGHDLPDAVQRGLIAMNRDLGLRFCTADLMFDGRDYWFIDLNPNGQWLWVEESTGLPIASTIAEALSVLAVDSLDDTILKPNDNFLHTSQKTDSVFWLVVCPDDLFDVVGVIPQYSRGDDVGFVPDLWHAHFFHVSPCLGMGCGLLGA